MDSRIKEWLEKVIELNITKPHMSEPTLKRILRDLGYPDTIDNVLLFLCGSYYAQILQQSRNNHGSARPEDEQGGVKLMAQRMVEIKEAYLERRLDV